MALGLISASGCSAIAASCAGAEAMAAGGISASGAGGPSCSRCLRSFSMASSVRSRDRLQWDWYRCSRSPSGESSKAERAATSSRGSIHLRVKAVEPRLQPGVLALEEGFQLDLDRQGDGGRSGIGRREIGVVGIVLEFSQTIVQLDHPPCSDEVAGPFDELQAGIVGGGFLHLVVAEPQQSGEAKPVGEIPAGGGIVLDPRLHLVAEARPLVEQSLAARGRALQFREHRRRVVIDVLRLQPLHEGFEASALIASPIARHALNLLGEPGPLVLIRAIELPRHPHSPLGQVSPQLPGASSSLVHVSSRC